MDLRRFALWALLSVSVHAQIKILNPDSLKKYYAKTNGVIMGSTSVFGAPYYGERVLGRLRGATSQKSDHCDPKQYKMTELQGDIQTNGERVRDILLIPHNGRGCSAVQKVIVAASKGAHAVILVDQTGQTDEQVTHKVVSDYGRGSEVTIPSILVSKDTGDRMYGAMRTDMVVVELSWDVPLAEVVNVDFWRSSASKESSNFLVSFKESAEMLGNKMQFVPHYYIFELPKGAGGGDLCADHASSEETRHCAPDPDGPGPVTGADVANEDIRQLCLWHKTAYAPDPEHDAKFSQAWWEYVTSLFDWCPMEAETRNGRFGSKYCSYQLMNNLGIGIDVDEVDACVKHHSGEYLEEQAKKQAWSEQALRINGWRYQGPLDSETVLKAVCSGYATPISECEELTQGQFSRMVAVVRHRFFKGLSQKAFTWMIVAICVLSVINCYLYRRYLLRFMKRQMREEVMLEVQSQMAEYSKLDGGGNGRV